MTYAQYRVSLEGAVSLVRVFELLQMDARCIRVPSHRFREATRSASYAEAFGIALEDYDFDVLLVDQSFLQFSYSRLPGAEPDLRYAYFQSPYVAKSYREFLRDAGLEPEEAGDLFYEDYSQSILDAPVREVCIPIRYDRVILGYVPGRHPTSHFHIGIGNSIRVPARCEVSPLMFVAFVLRHVYYDQWCRMWPNQRFQRIRSRWRSSCRTLSAAQFNADDTADLYLA